MKLNSCMIYSIFICMLISSCTAAPLSNPTPTLTLAPTPTPSPKLFNLELFVFHDFNANEEFEQELEELPLENIPIKLTDACHQNKEGLTDANGKISFDVCEGKSSIRIERVESLDNLNYLFINKEVLNAKKSIEFEVDSDTNHVIPLGNGPFTIPILEDSFEGISYVFSQYYENRYHGGLDIEIQGNGPQPIYAPINGMVNSDGGSFGDCNHVTIKYDDPIYNTAIYLGMGHLSEIEVNPYDEVKKGDLIGYINPDIYNPGDFACTSHPHIHMNIWASIPGLTWSGEGQDGGRWEILPTGEWGVLDPELFLARTNSPIAMFLNEEQVLRYSQE